MRITKWTKTKDVLPLINEKNMKELLERVPAYPFKSVLSMSIKEFAEIADDEYSFIVRKIFAKQRRFLKAFGQLKDFKEQMEQLGKFIGKFSKNQTPEEKQAARGIIFPSFIQRMLIDVVKFFNLKSFEEAEKVKVCDWLLVFQNESSNNLYQMNYQKILEQKQKLKSKQNKKNGVH